MNETTGNARTKPMRKPKSPGIPENFEREPLKEREMNSLSDSEKTNEFKINNNQEKAKLKIASFVYRTIIHEFKKLAYIKFNLVQFRTKIK